MTKIIDNIKKIEGFSGIDPKELQKIPYFDLTHKDRRTVFLAPFFTEKQTWSYWMPTPEGKMFEVQFVDIISQCYYSKTAVKETDLFFNFYQLLVQHLCFKETHPSLTYIQDDIMNLGSVLAQIDLFFTISKQNSNLTVTNSQLMSFVQTQIEYFFYLIRSLFNHLQEVTAALFSIFYDKTTGKKYNQLPKSFAQMVLKNSKLLTAEEICASKKIPLPLASLYANVGKFFKATRDFRDSIDHHGKGAPIVFVAEIDFLIHKNLRPFSEFPIWSDSDIQKNDLVPLSKALAYFLNETFLVFEAYALTLSKIVDLPKEQAPEFKIFLRTPNDEAFWRYKKLLT